MCFFRGQKPGQQLIPRLQKRINVKTQQLTCLIISGDTDTGVDTVRPNEFTVFSSLGSYST
jgi:hypothetical protein